MAKRRIDPKGECCASCCHCDRGWNTGWMCYYYTKTRFDPKSYVKVLGWHVIQEDGLLWRKCRNYRARLWVKNGILELLQEGREEDLKF